MEIDITRFVKTVDACDFSASRMELGQDAGKITWNNAKREAESTELIGEENRDEFNRWVRDFGAWEREEIEGWSLVECNALLIQYISGDLRELESLCYSDDAEYGIDWKKAAKLSSAGTISGNIWRDDDSRLYFYMGG